MNKKKFILSALTACSLLAAYSLPAVADSGPYLAADFGRAHFSGGIFDSGFIPPSSTTSVNDTVSANRFILGFQITPYWGVEAGYVDLGTATLSYPGTPSLGTYFIKADGAFVAGTGTWPISQQWSLYARAGVISSQVDYNHECNNGGCALFSSAQTTGSSATYGLGAKWNFLADWSLRLGWDRYRNLGNASYDANLLSLGVEFRLPTR